MMLKNKVYDGLKWVTIILMPALATLYTSLADVWGLPMVREVVGTINAATVFLGIILGISTMQYNKPIDFNDVDDESKDGI